MLKRLIPWSSTITVTVFAAMAFLQAAIVQFSYPQSSQTSATIFFSTSSFSRDQQIQQWLGTQPDPNLAQFGSLPAPVACVYTRRTLLPWDD